MDSLQDILAALAANPQILSQLGSRGSPQSGSAGDPSALFSSVLSGFSPDSHQQALLQALRPYLSPERIRRLQQAMQAARMAQLAADSLAGFQR